MSLADRIRALGDTWTDEHGTVHERPTAWAYAQACAALDRWKQRAQEAETERDHFVAMAHARHDEIGALRERAEAAEALNASIIADKNEWFAEAAKQATRAAEAMRRAEVAEAALREARANVAVECPNCAAMCNSETRTCWNCNALLGTWVAVGDAK